MRLSVCVTDSHITSSHLQAIHNFPIFIMNFIENANYNHLILNFFNFEQLNSQIHHIIFQKVNFDMKINTCCTRREQACIPFLSSLILYVSHSFRLNQLIWTRKHYPTQSQPTTEKNRSLQRQQLHVAILSNKIIDDVFFI